MTARYFADQYDHYLENSFYQSSILFFGQVINFFVQSSGRSTNMQLVQFDVFLWDGANHYPDMQQDLFMDNV